MIIVRILGVVLVLLALGTGLIWYDEAPDPEMQERFQGRPRVADESNLYLASVGVRVVGSEPLHVLGRRLMSQNAETLSLPPAHRKFYQYQGAQCKAIPPSGEYSCLFAARAVTDRTPIENQLAERYRALRSYNHYATEIDQINRAWVPELLPAQQAYIAAHLAVEDKQPIPVAELVADTQFLRDAMAASDSLLSRGIFSIALERNYRLVSEVVATGTVAHDVLAPLFNPLPAKATNLKSLLPMLYMEKLRENQRVRRMLLQGDDPYAAEGDIGAVMGLKVPASSFARRIKALQLKPVYHINRLLELGRGASSANTRSGLAETLMGFLNAGSEGVLDTTPLSVDNLKSFEKLIQDLDRYISLISIVSRLAQGSNEVNPESVLQDVRHLLPEDALSQKVQWDAGRHAFFFDPASAIWRHRAKQAGHGVLVQVPLRLVAVTEADQWQGYSARCLSGRCELVRAGETPILARRGLRLKEDTKAFYPEIGTVIPGKFVEIRTLNQTVNGDWTENSIRLRVKG